MVSRLNQAFKHMASFLTYRRKYIQIGRHAEIQNVSLDEYVNLAHHCQVSNSHVGLRSSIGRYSKIQYAEIGKYCSISWDVTIGAISHPLHSLSTHAFTYRKQFGICSKDELLNHTKVLIGNDVWIGCGAIIMPGVCIGDGAVIGAGSVVTHNVAAYEIVVGCPAKHLGERFPKDMVADLLKIKWWDWPDEKLVEYLDLFDPHLDITENENVMEKIKML